MQKYLLKVLAIKSNNMKRVIGHKELRFILQKQGWFNIEKKSINIIYHINILRMYMTISTDTEKIFNKLQHLLIIKILNKLETENNFLSFTKGIYKITTKVCTIVKDRILFPQMRSMAMLPVFITPSQHWNAVRIFFNLI